MDRLKKVLILLLLLFLVLCTTKNGISQVMHIEYMGRPFFSSMDYRIYMCVQYSFAYYYSIRYKRAEREVCNCFHGISYGVSGYVRSHSSTVSSSGENTIIIWDTSFIKDYVLPLFRKIEDRKRIILTLENSNDSTFKNIIDYDNKVIINDKMYYYPMNIRTCLLFLNTDYEWLKKVVPQSSWIYQPDCFDAGEMMRINVLIPLLN